MAANDPKDQKPQEQKPTVKIQDAIVDERGNTTKEDSQKYDLMLEKDFIKVGQPTNDEVHMFRVINHFPQYQSSNNLEYVSVFAIEEWKWDKGPDGSPRRQPITSFNMKARDFERSFKQTTV